MGRPTTIKIESHIKNKIYIVALPKVEEKIKGITSDGEAKIHFIPEFHFFKSKKQAEIFLNKERIKQKEGNTLSLPINLKSLIILHNEDQLEYTIKH